MHITFKANKSKKKPYRTPWHVLLDVVGLVDQSSALQDETSAALQVEGVVVDATRASLDQLQRHLDADLDTESTDCLVVVLDIEEKGFEHVSNNLWE